jgi:predicted XRE-type DNA-binding protein
MGKITHVKWLQNQSHYRGDECLYWRWSNCDGYGNFAIRGKQHYAHRYMCELIHGPAPSPEHQAAHSCGNGNKGCVTPRHISWKTPAENQQDRTIHGTQNNGKRGKLLPEEAEQIQALRGKMPQRQIAEMFNTTRSNVGYVQRKTWKKKTKGAVKEGNKFKAQIKIDGQYVRLGRYDTAEEAAAQYRKKLAEIRNS